MKYYLCFDIGGTSAKVALFDANDTSTLPKPVQRFLIEFPENKQLHPMLPYLVKEIKTLLKEELKNDTIQAVSIAATGQIDVRKGIVAGTCGNLPSWPKANLRAAFQDFLNVPVVVGNDANLMLLGEITYGAGKGYENVLGLTLGTGVGGGILCNKTLLEGAKGYAGEIGHLPVFGKAGLLCTCGLRGCIEQYCATSALLRSAEDAGIQVINAKEFCALKDSGQSPEAVRVFESWLDDLGFAITALVHLFNPELVLIGGGISAQGEKILAPLRERVYASVMPEFARDLKLEKALLENMAGLYGALANLHR